jgi:hypothetical protein
VAAGLQQVACLCLVEAIALLQQVAAHPLPVAARLAQAADLPPQVAAHLAQVAGLPVQRLR